MDLLKQFIPKFPAAQEDDNSDYRGTLRNYNNGNCNSNSRPAASPVTAQTPRVPPPSSAQRYVSLSSDDEDEDGDDVANHTDSIVTSHPGEPIRGPLSPKEMTKAEERATTSLPNDFDLSRQTSEGTATSSSSGSSGQVSNRFVMLRPGSGALSIMRTATSAPLGQLSSFPLTLYNPIEASPLVPTPRSPTATIPVMNILVIGDAQSGKSSFINAYRTAVCQSEHWPLAPTGKCGVYGTTSIDGCPNHSSHHTWVLIDTPGKQYQLPDDDDSDSAMDGKLLRQLFSGLPWKTKLVGPGQRTPEDLDMIITPSNKPHQCILVVSALDFVADEGLSVASVFKLRLRYAPVKNDEKMRTLQKLITRVRALLDDEPPFVVVTHMDLLGGVDSSASRAIVLSQLRECIPANRTFFVGVPQGDPMDIHATKKKVPPVDGARELRKLHREVLDSFRWRVARDKEALKST